MVRFDLGLYLVSVMLVCMPVQLVSFGTGVLPRDKLPREKLHLFRFPKRGPEVDPPTNITQLTRRNLAVSAVMKD